MGGRGLRGAAAVLLLAGSTGCGPLVVQQGARTVRPGQTQAGTSLNVVSTSSDEGGVDTRQTSVGVVPNAWVRRGLGEQVDVGAQFYGGGLRIDGKYAFVKSEKLAFAAFGGLAGGSQSQKDEDFGIKSSSSTTSTSVDAGLLGTFGVTSSIDVNVVARGMYFMASTDEKDGSDKYSSDSTSTAAGGALSLTWRSGDFAVCPEIAFYSVDGTSKDSDDVEDDFSSTIIVPSLGFSVGF